MKNKTREMLNMLPPWMKINDDDSVGAQILDVISTQLDELEKMSENILRATDLTISTYADPDQVDPGVDLLEIDFLYKVYLNSAVSKDGISSVISENGPMEIATSIYNFYMRGDNTCYYDSVDMAMYFKKNFQRVIINGAEFSYLEEHHVWNPLDEIGLLLGCPRLKSERNMPYKSRLIDVFKNRGNATKDGLKNYISRSIGVEKEDIIIDSLDDDDFVNSMIKGNGELYSELEEYISISQKINRFGLNTYWETIDEFGIGVKYLPMVWTHDLENWEISKIQNGIGDTDHLSISFKRDVPSNQEFKYEIFAEGLNYPDIITYPEHSFKYKIFATGQRYDKGYKPEFYQYSIQASELIRLILDIIAYKEYKHEYRLLFDKNVVTMEQVNEDKLPHNADYILGGVSIKDGSYCVHPGRRYIEVLANMETNIGPVEEEGNTLTPTIDNITIVYEVNGLEKKVIIDNEDTVKYVNGINDAAGILVGFESNTWTDTTPIIKVKNDTNDSYNTVVDDQGLLNLAQGEYQKIYNSEGDWDDGKNNIETINTHITENGTLRLFPPKI